MEWLSQNPLETEKYQTPHDILVRTTDGYLVKWERAKIVASLIRETELASHMTGLPRIKREEAEEIAKRVESRVKKMGVSLVSAPLIRELVNNVLIELSGREKRFLVYRNFYARVGAPVYDSYQIDLGLGFEAKENANLQPNPESSHKKKADRMCKEQYLLMMPPEIADAHVRGDVHIHDLEYFGTRSFCMDHDLRYFLYYGFMPDGTGHRASVAKPARHAEVAILHSVKVLAAAQTNFSGGQGFFNYLVFLAPYIRGLNEREVEQLMQMMFYELTQSYVSRGGQLVFSNIQVQPGVPEIWRDKPVVARGKVGPDVYGDYEDEVSALFRALHNVALEGDAWGKPFNFPKMEEQLAPEFLTSRYEDAWLLVHRAAARHGIPYFDNLTPAYRGYGKGVSCYQCLPGDELVITRGSRGIEVKEIRELSEADEVLSFSPNDGSARFSKPKGIFSTFHEGPLHVIQLEGGRRVKATGDHPVTVERNGRLLTLPAREVRKGDRVPVLIRLPRSTMERLEVEESVREVRARRTLPKSIPVTEELAELLGLYLAEGDAEEIPRGAIVRFSFGKHEKHLAERTKSLVNEVFGLEARLYEFKTALVVQVGNKQLYKFLTDQLKMGHNSYGKDVPDAVFHFPTPQVWRFIKSAFAGDGGMSLGHNQSGYPTYGLRLRLASKRAAQKVALLSSIAGLPLAYYEHHYGNGDQKIYVCDLTSRDAIAHFEAEEPTIHSQVVYLRVKKIKVEDYRGMVYDPVDVDGNHFANGLGVVTHNCCAYCFTDTPENDENFEAKMHFEDGAHFSMGGWQVVSLNLPRAAYLARGDDEELLQKINDQVDVAVRVFQLKKHWMNKMIALGRIPFVTQRPLDPSNGDKAPPLVDTESLVYTVGLVGVNEMVQHHAGAQLHESRDAFKLALKTLIGVKEHVEERAKETSLNLGIARTPAESTAQSFAVADLMSDEFREMSRKTVKGDVERSLNVLDGVRDLPVFYSNGTHLYVGADVTLAEKIEAEQKFFPLLDGGNMFHVWLGEAYSGPEALYTLTRKISATNIGYFAYTKDLTICGSCGATTSGMAEACPMCGSNKVTVWSRITGYYQDVSGWNEGKLSELRRRRRMGA